MAELGAELENARAGHARMVVVEGPAGMGKSALLRNFVASVTNASALWVEGEKGEHSLAFGVAERLFRSAKEAEKADVGSATDPVEAGRKLLALIVRVASAAPVIMVIDDAQWVDPESAAALVYALRRLQSEPVVSILVTRDVSALSEGLRRLAADQGRAVQVAGLGIAELRQLAAVSGIEPVSRLCVERILDHTGGSPGHTRSLYEELGDHVRRCESPLPAPQAFCREVLDRLAPCSHPARRLVEAIAVLGVKASVAAASDVAGVEVPQRALQELEEAGLIRRVESLAYREVELTHPLVRSAIYHDLALPLRAELHLRAAGVTAAEASLEHRAAAAVLGDGPLCGELAAHAAAEVAAGELSDAARHLVTAARVAPDKRAHEQLLLHALGLFQQSGEAIEVLSWTEEIATFEESCAQQLVLGQQALLDGNGAEAERRLARGATLAAADAGSRCAVGCQILLAQICALNLRLHDAIEWSRAACEGCSDPLEAAGARSALATCLGAAGRTEEGLRLLEPVGRAQDCAPHELAMVMSRGLLHLWSDDLYGAREDLAGLQDRARARPAFPIMLLGLAWLADVEYRLGGWAESKAHADRAVALAAECGVRWVEPFVLAAATWARAGTGDWNAARRHVDAALSTAMLNTDLGSRLLASTAAANLAWAMNDPLAVVDAVEDLDSLADDEVQEPGLYPWREVYADALVTLGRLEEAEGVLEVVEGMARRCSRLSSLARVSRIRGRIASSRRDDVAALAAFEDATALAAQVPAPFERALVDDAYGRFLRREGRRRSAAERLAAAHDTFSALGARPFASRTEIELAGCGLRPRGRAAGPQGRLTPQELSVARLVVLGLLNREVAAELVVSVKTIEFHLSNIYAKLGIQSRRQLAERLCAE